jgi:GDPmannose 4,6-dehydratase
LNGKEKQEQVCIFCSHFKVEEYGVDSKTQKKVVGINPIFFRPTDTAFICGDPSKAEKKLGWKREYSFNEMIASMVKNDLELVSQNKL